MAGHRHRRQLPRRVGAAHRAWRSIGIDTRSRALRLPVNRRTVRHDGGDERKRGTGAGNGKS